MRTRKLIGFALAPALILLVSIRAADSWLESAAGRARLESAMSEALSQPVHLNGDFNISLWPSLGISGDDLLIGETADRRTAAADSAGDGVLLRCDTYHAAIALWPLLRGRLEVLAVRAANGEVDPGRFGSTAVATPGGESQPPRLPRIDFLQLENFRIRISDSGDPLVLLEQLEIDGFQVDRETPLTLDLSIVRNGVPLIRLVMESSFRLDGRLERLALAVDRLDVLSDSREVREIAGSANWNRSQNEIGLHLEGQVPDLGRGVLSLAASPDTRTGQVRFEIHRSAGDEGLAAGLALQPMPGGFGFSDIHLESMGQQIRGQGCLLSGMASSLSLQLHSDRIDLDRLRSWLPEAADSGSGFDLSTFDWPIDLRIRLDVDEVRSGKVVAQRVRLGTDGEPDCSTVAD